MWWSRPCGSRPSAPLLVVAPARGAWSSGPDWEGFGALGNGVGMPRQPANKRMQLTRRLGALRADRSQMLGPYAAPGGCGEIAGRFTGFVVGRFPGAQLMRRTLGRREKRGEADTSTVH
jgi:hypothetical protein